MPYNTLSIIGVRCSFGRICVVAGCITLATRGLDPSPALEYVRAVRALTDTLGLASIDTLYQAGNGIYHLFNKVLVLDGGL